MLILRRQRLGGVDHEQRHVGARDGADGAHHAVLLDRAFDVPGAPYAGRVDEEDLLALVLEQRVRGVAGGARHLRDQHAREAQQGIEQRRLAHVGPAHDGETQGVALILRLFDHGQVRD